MHNFKNIILKTSIPLLIGLGVVAWLFSREFSIDDWKQIHWSSHIVWTLSLAVVALCCREFGMMWRFRILSDKKLSWTAAFRVTLLCEFTSSITPTSAGGSALSMVFMNKEGLSLGRATSITMTTFLLDEALFVILCPLVFILVGKTKLFGFDPNTVESGIRAAYWVVWSGIVAVTILLLYGIVLRPHLFKSFVMKVFSIGKLKRWLPNVDKTTDEMVIAGKEIKDKSFGWWFRSSSATICLWFSRFLVVNALFLAFAEYAPQLVVFARQIVVWTLLSISPTPGGSGVSEWLFTTYYGDLLNDVSIALVIAIFWRIITYYSYLIAGICILPSWFKKFKIKSDSL